MRNLWIVGIGGDYIREKTAQKQYIIKQLKRNIKKICEFGCLFRYYEANDRTFLSCPKYGIINNIMTKYALLFSGGINARYNYNRYANDLGFAYKVLTEKLQYLPQNITVMYSDGTPINYDNITINTTIATKDKFLLKIADYTQQINQNDFFTFIASNHGDKNGELCTWHDNSIERTEFINAIENIECLKIIIMGQCYGGNYTDSQNKIKNSVVLSANVSDQPSYGKIAKASNGKYVVDKNNDYDEFLYNFFSYYNESYPCGKPLNSTKTENTLVSAYEYAKNNDFLINGIYLDGKTTT